MREGKMWAMVATGGSEGWSARVAVWLEVMVDPSGRRT
jgi:hypothetical protein